MWTQEEKEREGRKKKKKKSVRMIRKERVKAGREAGGRRTTRQGTVKLKERNFISFLSVTYFCTINFAVHINVKL